VYKRGTLAGVLPAGKRQVYWRGPVDVRVERVDVSGDLEVPTALWQVQDAVVAHRAASNVVEYLYKALQVALREAIGTRSLDELLAQKGQLDREIETGVAERIKGLGVGVTSVGIKDRGRPVSQARAAPRLACS
jgi:regulator of protease activity HflC (stomatin/prohibitin superfamily)